MNANKVFLKILLLWVYFENLTQLYYAEFEPTQSSVSDRCGWSRSTFLEFAVSCQIHKRASCRFVILFVFSRTNSEMLHAQLGPDSTTSCILTCVEQFILLQSTEYRNIFEKLKSLTIYKSLISNTLFPTHTLINLPYSLSHVFAVATFCCS